MIYFQIFMLIVSLVVSYAMRPKPPVPTPASLKDFDVPVAEQGRPVPVVFGTVTITGPNVLWYGDLRTTAIQEKGGKK